MSVVYVKSPRNYGVTPHEVMLNSSLDGDFEAEFIAHQILPAAYEFVAREAKRSLVVSQWRQSIDEFPDQIVIERGPLISIDSVQYTDTAGETQTLASTEYRLEVDRSRPLILPAYDTSWPSTDDVPGAVKVTYTSGHGNLITSFDDSANRITPTDHKFHDGRQVTLSNLDGALPTGLETGKTYYVVGRNATTIQLSTELRGDAVSISSDATGSSFIDDVPEGLRQAIAMLASYWFENREAFTMGKVHNNLGIRLTDLISSSGGQHWYL